jgi:hypothetical protein
LIGKPGVEVGAKTVDHSMIAREVPAAMAVAPDFEGWTMPTLQPG